MYPWLIYPLIVPKFPTDNDKPPTLYALLNSLVNYNSDNKIKIKDLAKEGHKKIFNFYYPLSSNINRDEFEIIILNKFLTRRIGFETLTSFQIQLNVKLNEIMPIYNKLFDSLEGWDLFNDGEIINRTLEDTKKNNSSNNLETTGNIKGNNTNNNITDLRYAQMPQNQLEDLRNGNYVTDYNYNTVNVTDTTNSDTKTNTKGTSNSDDKQNVTEIISKTPSNKIDIYQKFIENRQSIYTMIFKELDSLFYQIIY